MFHFSFEDGLCCKREVAVLVLFDRVLLSEFVQNIMQYPRVVPILLFLPVLCKTPLVIYDSKTHLYDLWSFKEREREREREREKERERKRKALLSWFCIICIIIANYLTLDADL